jgi:hypothetical protein
MSAPGSDAEQPPTGSADCPSLLLGLSFSPTRALYSRVTTAYMNKMTNYNAFR